MSTTSPASNTYDDEEIAELVRMLLCLRRKDDTKQVGNLKSKWIRAIERFARRKSADVSMGEGEADDTIGELDRDISNLMERRLRLVERGRARVRGAEEPGF